MNQYLPIEWVEYVGEKLGDLCDDVVFLGGAVVGLLVTAPGARAPRPTKDVDVTTGIWTLNEFYKLDQVLPSKGFRNDMNGPLCRYLHGVVTHDVMPVNPDVLGFTNRWYPHVIETASPLTLKNGLTIKLITAPCFLATKLEAFRDPNRENHDDMFLSRDFGDIVSVIDGRPTIVDEIASASEEIRRFLAEGLSDILAANYLEEAIAEHVDQGREVIVIDRLASISNR